MGNNKKQMKTINGNWAASSVAYALSEAAAIYPITPSSDMAEYCDAWMAKGQPNVFGNVPRVVQYQSEAGAAGALHGLAAAGALSTTFTASQGLLLMIPNMYKIVGELLPCVIHVSARSLASHALSIFGDHSDIYSTRSTGFAMLSSNSVQEAQDMALVAHLATIEASYPFLHFFDGFRTSHELNKVVSISDAAMLKLVNQKKLQEFRSRALNPLFPHQAGTAQNPDTYFQNREACNKHVAAIYDIVESYMTKVNKLVGKNYAPFEYVGDPNAKHVVIAMGSGCETIEETITKLNANGADYGLLKVRLYRPFNAAAFVAALPTSTQVITVLDRTKENGALGDPLYTDVCTALFESKITHIKTLAGRYGLSSKEFTPDIVATIYENMSTESPRTHFTVGINDDVTHTNLETKHFPELVESGGYVFYGLGSDGTVSATRNSVSIIGDNTNMYAQGYFVFDSKKSGSTTISHLRFGKDQIKSAYLVKNPSFVACHNQSFLNRFDMLGGIKDSGTFLLNTTYTKTELEKILPNNVKRILATKNINFYTINAYKIAHDLGLKFRINTIMQAAFFKLANVVPFKQAKEFMKAAAKASYGKKGEAVLQMNYDAIDSADSSIERFEIPGSWAQIEIAKEKKPSKDKYYNEFCHLVNTLRGDELPVSSFSPDGRVPTGTSQFEKRNIATTLPKWLHENCIQCNQCVAACPHATIRPHLLDNKQVQQAPKDFVTLNATGGFADKQYRLQLNQEDCTGCGVCVNVCPSKEKALKMVDFNQIDERKNYEFTKTIPYPDVNPTNIKNSQFLKPYFEFSGACAGCGQTPYIKLISQLFGKRMIIANATGCTSIYGGSSPVCPYTKDENGRGPSWANSLFEDTAEFGHGIRLAYDLRRDEVIKHVKTLADSGDDKAAKYLETLEDANENDVAIDELLAHLKTQRPTGAKEIIARADVLDKKSVWIIGGDGWAYDIGYGGLDHVIAQNEDVNILVLDTEVYSNTGGQQSKATPAGAIAKFAAGGKPTNKKDLGLIAMNYDNVYIAQIAIGANYAQTLNAIKEAEAHRGPSVLIAYATCINHGIDMSQSMKQMKDAVACGYWTMYRRSPEYGLKIDSKPPTEDFREFLMKETRYSSLLKVNPEAAERLFEEARLHAERQRKKLERNLPEQE